MAAPKLSPGALNCLRARRGDFGRAAAAERLEAFLLLESLRLANADEVLELHEALCLSRAYPDDEEVLAIVQRMLAAFAERPDLKRHCDQLAGSGIAGTELASEFYWFTADWLATRWPDLLRIDWKNFPNLPALDDVLVLLLEEHEILALEGTLLSTQDFVDEMRAPGETDANYLIHGFRRVSSNALVCEGLYDAIGVPLCLAPGPSTPSRTEGWFSMDPPVFQEGPLQPNLPVDEAIAREPKNVWRVPPRTGRELVDLGHGALIARGRDLFAFMHADENDALLVDYGEGLQFACLGLLPPYRHLVYGQYIYLALKNGVPVAYIQACVLFDSAEINFNLFDTFRQTEASRIFTSSLALTRELFEVDAFSINTQQLGEGNPEAIKTGAWWFYYKHGFRPYGDDLKDVVENELKARKKDRSHRTNAADLRQLSTQPLHYFIGKPRPEIFGRLDLSPLGFATARKIGKRFDVSGLRAARASAAEAARRLRLSSRASWSPAEKQAWRRMAPLVLALPLEEWSTEQKRDLVPILRAKGSRSERDYLLLLRQHERICHDLLEILTASTEGEALPRDKDKAGC